MLHHNKKEAGKLTRIKNINRAIPQSGNKTLQFGRKS